MGTSRILIIARSPLRISLGGGGTDLPSYYGKNEGFTFSAAIDKYVYVNVAKPFHESIKLKYSEFEEVDLLSQIKHPIFREALKLMNPNESRIELISFADIPSGTGLGSSGSFTTALLFALAEYYDKKLSKSELAEMACEVEIEILKENVGKQDQYIAAYGGFTSFTYRQNGQVVAEQTKLKNHTIQNLEENLLLFYTGLSRSAGSILTDQVNKSSKNDVDMQKNLDYVKKLGYQARDLIMKDNLYAYGELMNEHWKYKQKRSQGISNDLIDSIYEIAMKHGAIGGKLVGAGGGGFLMFYCDDTEKLRAKMVDLGMPEVHFKFDFKGTSLVLK
jgi:D-glycero-alpha-D-manno-heptose-7-phosphate kinase